MYTCVCAQVDATKEEDLISFTLKVITLIKAVMCGDRGGKGGRGKEEPAFFYRAV